MTDPLPILIHSNAPWVPSGYGVQTAHVARKLRDDGEHVGVSAFWGQQSGVLSWEGIPVYPAGRHGYGIDVWDAHAQRHGGDDTIILSLIDAWVLNRPAHVWAGWVPIDHDPIPDAVAERCAQMDVRIAMSRFGQAKMEQAGLDSVYLPHAYDPATLYPDADAAEKFRASIGVPLDKPLVGVVAANQGGFPSRKNLPAVVEALAMLVQAGADVYAYFHCSRGSKYGGMAPCELEHQAVRMGIADRVRFADEYRLLTGESPDFMRGAYSAFDVLCNPSLGEGFGVPIVEAQACGTPVVVGRWTAMAELCFGGVFIEQNEALPWWTAQGSHMWMAGPGVIAQALQGVLDPARSSLAQMRASARAGAADYAVDAVWAEHWPAVRAAIVAAAAQRKGDVVVEVAP